MKLLVLDGYFDESGTHQSSNAVAVAGYLSTPEQWKLFETEWTAALDRWGLKQFHMADFAVRAKEYAHWTDQDRRFRFAHLVGIINRHTLASVANPIPVQSFNLTFTKQAKRFVGGPYGAAANACFMEAARILDPEYPSATIAYVFESGAQGAGEVRKVFQWNHSDPKNRDRFKLLSLNFKGKEVVPLQAADILAYELYKHLPRQIGLDPRTPRFENVGILSECKLRSWGYIGDEQMTTLARIAEIAAKFHGSKTKGGRRVKTRR